MQAQDQLIGPLVRENRRLEDKVEAWLDLLDAAGLAVVCRIDDGECLVNPAAREHLEKSGLSPERAEAILEEKGIVPIAAEPGLIVWERRAKESSRALLGSLSRRELEVSRWLRKGKSADEIGAILGISSRTVEKHIQRIYTKCDIRSHVEFLRLLAHGEL